MDDLRRCKRLLRKAIVTQILALDPAERQQQDTALRDRFPALPGFAEAQTVLLYASAFPEEFATGPLLTMAREAGKRLACPRVDLARECLVLAEVDDPASDLVPGMKGIPEPREGLTPIDPRDVDWALVPGLAFDGNCQRLGRGRGHYDRLLPKLGPEVPRWALALDPQWVEFLPTEGHDQPLTGVAGVGRTARRL